MTKPPAAAHAGDRVRLVSCDDPHTRLTPGAEGTVSLVDDLGTLHVTWDDGSNLGLIPDLDHFTVLPADQQRTAL